MEKLQTILHELSSVHDAIGLRGSFATRSNTDVSETPNHCAVEPQARRPGCQRS
jgi:hypothetical protein